MKFKFHKYQGTGNDFVLIDNRGSQFTGEEYALFKNLCDRHMGIGADGVILLNEDSDSDFEMDYFNSDGNRSTMCGNGGRCMVRFAADLGIIKEHCTFSAIDGLHTASLTDRGIKLKMSVPKGFQKISDHDYWIDTGSPHFVRFTDAHPNQVEVVQLGREIRNSEPWNGEGTNVNFVKEIEGGKLFMRTYERGVEDETLSCGTGVTAAAEVYRLKTNYTNSVIHVLTKGGELWVHPDPADAPSLEGPAVHVFSGNFIKS